MYTSKSQRGISLIELILFIVIVSAALAGLLLVMNVNTRSSVDPLIQKQVLAIAESLLEEIELQDFSNPFPGSGVVVNRGSFDDVFDYNGTNWLTSATDSVSSLTFGSPFNYQRITGGAWTTSTPAGGQVTAGVLPFTLTKPTGGGTGSVDVSISAPDYFLTGSNVQLVNPSNTARATFGIYKGNSKFIYIRELY